MYEFSRDAIKKYHRLGGLNNRNLFSHSYGHWKSKIEVLANWFLLRPPPRLVDGYLLLLGGSHGLPSVCFCELICSS